MSLLHRRDRLRSALIGVSLLAVGLLLAGDASGANAQTPAGKGATPAPPLQVSDILGVREFADRVQVDLSPDGKFMAFSLQDPTRAAVRDSMPTSQYFGATGVPRGHRGTDVHVTDVLSAQTRNITQGRGANWSPVWSPDGRTLAFLSDRDGAVRVWLWHRPTRVLRRLSAEPVRVFFGFESIRWSPSGRRVAVKLSPLGLTRAQLDQLLPAPAKPAATTPPVRSADGVSATVYVATQAGEQAATPPLAVNLDSTRSFLNAELRDLAVIDVVSGRVAAAREPGARHGLALGARRALHRLHHAPAGRRPRTAGVRQLRPVRRGHGGPRRRGSSRLASCRSTASTSPGRRAGVRWRSRRTARCTSLGAMAAWRSGSKPVAARSRTGIARRCGRARTRCSSVSADTLWRVSVPGGDATPSRCPRAGGCSTSSRPPTHSASRAERLSIAVHDPATKLSGFRTIDFTNGTYTGALEEAGGARLRRPVPSGHVGRRTDDLVCRRARRHAAGGVGHAGAADALESRHEQQPAGRAAAPRRHAAGPVDRVLVAKCCAARC